MNNLNRQNFFNNLVEKFPIPMADFYKWIDRYKEQVGWNQILGNELTGSPKFHDLPFELQYGVLLRYFSEIGQLMFINHITAIKFFEDMFQCEAEKKKYYDYVESPGVSMIGIERRQHTIKHGNTEDSDKSNNDGEMLKFAAAIILKDNAYYPTWWDIKRLEKVLNKSEIEQWVIAGSMIAGEIDLKLADEKLDDGLRNSKNGTPNIEGQKG